MSHHYSQAVFFKTAPGVAHLPPDDALEVAFVGRSNSGKSSALNLLTRQRKLAKTSKTPGRTQAINYFALGELIPPRFLVDLPGYGFAKVPDRIRHHWEHELSRYLKERRSLAGMVVLVDIRRGLGELDWTLIRFCLHRQLPVRILLSKADKLSRGAALAACDKARRTLNSVNAAGAEPAVSVQLFSVLNRMGVDEACAWLDARLQLPAGKAVEAAAGEDSPAGPAAELRDA